MNRAGRGPARFATGSVCDRLGAHATIIGAAFDISPVKAYFP